jgi:hypothetical protein
MTQIQTKPSNHQDKHFEQVSEDTVINELSQVLTIFSYDNYDLLT